MLLALLLLRRNEVTAASGLVDELWRGAPTPTAQTALHGYVGRLRKQLGRERLVTRASGYVLLVGEGELDAERFERLLEDGRASDALALWRGPAFFDVRDESFARAEAGRLEELRLVAHEHVLRARVEQGQASEAVPELAA